jgi:hypothetical protein
MEEMRQIAKMSNGMRLCAVFVLLYGASTAALWAGSTVAFVLLAVTAQLVAARAAVAAISARRRRFPQADTRVGDRAWVRALVSESRNVSAQRVAQPSVSRANSARQVAEVVAAPPRFFGVVSRSTDAVVALFLSPDEAFATAQASSAEPEVVLVDFTTGVGRVHRLRKSID